MSSDADFPQPETGLAIHSRLLAQDPTAPDDLATAYLGPLTRYLAACNRGTEPFDPYSHANRAFASHSIQRSMKPPYSRSARTPSPRNRG
jgi:hypothetical protein